MNKRDIKKAGLLVIVNKWFDRTYGNTYHAIRILDKDNNIIYTDEKGSFHYGYGDHYKTTTCKALGLDDYDYQTLRDCGVRFVDTGNGLKRELHIFSHSY